MRKLAKKGSAFLLSKKECASLNPPHRRQLVVHDTTGSAQVCVLCGTVLERTRNTKPTARRRSRAERVPTSTAA